MARESCFCGWVGELEDRELVYAGAGEWGLGCPMCGHLDRLETWSEAARAWILAEVARRRERISREYVTSRLRRTPAPSPPAYAEDDC
jgi:hypothetical protein